MSENTYAQGAAVPPHLREVRPRALQGGANRNRSCEAAKRGSAMNTANPRMNSGLFTSATDEWETPPAFFEEVNREFKFTLDVAANAENAKCPMFFTPSQDGLAQAWRGVCWMNPPYGRNIGAWMQKAYLESLEGATVVCLIPSRTDTRWFHSFAMKGEVRFIKGRLRFGGSKDNAPFPSALVVFRGGSNGQS